MQYDIVIIGAGSAGISAGIYAVSRGKKTLIIEKDMVGGIIGKVSTVTHYSGIVEKETGKTFIDLLSGKRIEAAKELLMCTSMKIKEISEKCGYSDQHYFSYCFKKYSGVSPNALRRQMRAEEKA